MSSLSKPLDLSWTSSATLVEVNRQLSTQLFNANKMIDELYTIIKDLTARIEALE